jgi:hypothetical protein
MTARKIATKSVSKPTKSNSNKKEVTPMKSTLPASQAAAPANPAPATAAPPTPLSLALPPPDANVPAPPADFVPTNGSEYNGVQPRKSEQVVLAAAISDVGKIPNYAAIEAVTAIPQAQLVQMLQLGSAWTSMHNKSSAWDAFCRTQEGVAWSGIRVMMTKVKPAFELAMAADPSLRTRLPGLTALLGAQKAIAQRGVSTKEMNKKAVAEGKAPVHGKVGKSRKRSAEKAALAGTTAAPPPTVAAPVVASPAAPSSGEAAAPAAQAVVTPNPAVASTPIVASK